jgi:serine/threonine-protein kinase PpkA
MDIQGFTIKREIGKGGMATVYLATQESLHRDVVLKLLDDQVDNSDLGERFLAEGRILASLKHPNIITIYDIGIADEQLYISMEYVQGGDLKQRLELPVSAEEALEYLSQVSSALGEAHKHGIVHRDVKPANILFADNDTPILTDFGIAKEVDTEYDLTSTGIFLGSPNYVSPEQADGQKIDGRADIYSLGCIFYEMLTGSKPYISSSLIDIVIQHKQGPIPDLPEDLSEFQPLLNRMMAKQRDERFSDADELIAAIESLKRSRNTMETFADFDVTGTSDELRKKRASKILTGLMLLGLVMFSSLKYVEISIKDDTKKNNISTNSVLTAKTVVIPETTNPVPAEVADSDDPEANGQTVQATPTPEAPPPLETITKPEPVTADVMNALAWLGKQSLEEYKLTFPPKDNAYYYFSRMLELQPGNKKAISGILAISDRYYQQAEQALATNQQEKMLTYIEYGLKINPRNESLIALKSLARSQDTSLLGTIKSLFSK